MDTSSLYELMWKKADDLHTERVSIFPPKLDILLGFLDKTHTMSAIFTGFKDFYVPESSCPDREYPEKRCNCQAVGCRRRLAFLTIEQVSLGFVMLALFDKEWISNEWVSQVH